MTPELGGLLYHHEIVAGTVVRKDRRGEPFERDLYFLGHLPILGARHIPDGWQGPETVITEVRLVTKQGIVWQRKPQELDITFGRTKQH